MTKYSSVEYYENNQKRLQKESHERYKSFSIEEKEKKKQQYGRKQQKNLLENEKQKLIEYRKKCYKLRKKKSCLIIV